jgi:hypothetical protein
MSEKVLGVASREWATRPQDQRFGSLAELHRVVLERTARTKEHNQVEYGKLRVEAADGDVRLVGESNRASLTHWAFGQLCSAVKSPAKFLRELPATLAAQVLNNRLAERGNESGDCKLLVDQGEGGGQSKVRAFTGTGYARIWDSEITERLLRLEAEGGWQPAPAAFDGGRGLYASDHDVFAFMVDNGRRIFETLPGGGLSRGFIVANSEAGDKSFWMLRFLYQYICGNHNIWGVEGIEEVNIRHVGEAGKRAWGEMQVTLKGYAEASAGEDEGKIRRAMAKELAASKEELVDKLFGLKSLGLTRGLLEKAYEHAEEHEGWYLAAPTSAWGMGNGITGVAREIVNADERVRVERAAGKVMEMGF